MLIKPKLKTYVNFKMIIGCDEEFSQSVGMALSSLSQFLRKLVPLPNSCRYFV